MQEYIQQVLDKGWIQPLTSPAGAPILFVLKKDGGLCLCVDYHGLNAVTLKNHYLISLVNEIMDHLSGVMIFTQLDLWDAYHQIQIQKEDEYKTTFCICYGHFEYQVMPFGLANAPVTF